MKGLQVANMALDLLGVERISSLNDPTRFAKAVATSLPVALDEVLRSYDWPFAIKHIVPTGDESAGPYLGYIYAYNLPSDCVSVISFGNSNYKSAGQYIYSNLAPESDGAGPVLEYISMPNIDNDDLPPVFGQLSAMYLAYLMADIVGRGDRAALLKSRYDMALSNMITRDSNNYRAQDMSNEKSFIDY